MKAGPSAWPPRRRRSAVRLTAQAVAAYREALAIAEALGMRPLEGRCHLGLAPVLAFAREISGARSHLSRAGELFAALGLDRWGTEAKAVSAELAY